MSPFITSPAADSPVGHIYRTTRSYRNFPPGQPGTQKGNMEIREGDVGEVLGISDANRELIHVSNIRTMQRGWVRMDRIDIGDAIVREDVLFDVDVADDNAQIQYIPVDVKCQGIYTAGSEGRQRPPDHDQHLRGRHLWRAPRLV